MSMDDPSAGTPPPPPSQSPTTPPPAPPTTPSSGGGASDNRTIMVVLAYLWLLALIPLLVEKEDREVQWHAKHGLVLLVAEVVFWIVWTILTSVLGALTGGILGCVFGIAGLLIFLGILVVHVLCIVKGTKGERFLLPVVSDFADRF